MTRPLLPIVAVALFLIVNLVVFRTPLYPRVLAPESAANAFDAGLRRVAAASRDAGRDVLVLGDSRIFNGLDEATADAAAGGGLRFINAGVPGTTPRCWYVFDRALDPAVDRYKAVVIPVDTYADDDSAIGSVDASDHVFDLHYLVFHTAVADVWKVATSFRAPDLRVQALVDLTLGGPLVRDDVQALIADPAARLAALRGPPPPDLTPSLRSGSLRGLQVDFAHERVTPPPGFPAGDVAQLQRQLLLQPSPSASYAAYRREWLGAIVDRYRSAGIPIVFVRIPTRPLHRGAPAPLDGSLLAFSRLRGVTALPQDAFVTLETPQLFGDADHLNAAGARRFSALLGADVARALRSPVVARRTRITRSDAGPVRQRTRDVGGPARAAAPPMPTVAAPATAAPSLGTPMRFQSYEFAIFFFATAALYYLVRLRALRLALLLAASWYFYARWNAWYLAVLIGLTATDYAFGLAVQHARGAARRLALIAGIGANLAFLGTVKYADFLTGSLAGVLGVRGDPWALHVLVPVGISFHTFQSISYLVDISRGNVRAMRNPLRYALYLAFFPQLLAGPIVRAQRFLHEWSRVPHLTRPRGSDLAAGAWLITLGFFKKSVLADRFAGISDGYFGAIATHPGALTAWSGVFAFAMQIYFDFSGYSDIAIGCARVFGFRFPANFRRPYLAWSPTEFWRRWHMTLSRWLRDYLYIPLGGNRHGALATARNLMLTMLLGGLWHGANWTFVAWGGYHGALLAIERLAGLRPWTDRARAHPGGRVVAVAITFVLVVVGWVLFRATSFGDVAAVFAAMLTGGPGPSLVGGGVLLVTGIVFVIEIWSESGRLQLARFPVLVQASAVALVAVTLELGLFTGSAAPFIYFKF